MTIREILTLPDPILRQQSRPVEKFDAELRQLADDMLETMHDAPGIGLAGAQIGILLRIAVIHIPEDEEVAEPLTIINPQILAHSKETGDYEEGCLSIPDFTAEISRPANIHLRYQQLDGEFAEIKAGGILAICLQHEIDHMNGILFIDYLSRLKRERVVKRFQKMARPSSA